MSRILEVEYSVGVGKRKVGNPLALAVLALVAEKPMHPYEMSSTLRERAKEQSIKLNYGSLYSVVESLVRHGLIEVQETVREGRRPERTVYAITDPGRIELVDWLSELVAVPAKEYLQFEAALSLLPVLSPDEALRLLEARRMRLDADIAAADGILTGWQDESMAYLWAIEHTYVQVLRRAERDFVVTVIEKIRKGELAAIKAWRHAHEVADGVPGEPDWEEAVQQEGVNWPIE
jgi:DNA-binding PadR family transcriptional regulator